MSWSRLIFRFSAGLEVLAGLISIVAPARIIYPLFGQQTGSIAIDMARLFGIAVLVLGLITWEKSGVTFNPSTRLGLCFYNLSAGVLLACIGLNQASTGPALWPVALIHIGLGFVMSYLIFKR